MVGGEAAEGREEGTLTSHRGGVAWSVGVGEEPEELLCPLGLPCGAGRPGRKESAFRTWLYEQPSEEKAQRHRHDVAKEGNVWQDAGIEDERGDKEREAGAEKGRSEADAADDVGVDVGSDKGGDEGGSAHHINFGRVESAGERRDKDSPR